MANSTPRGGHARRPGVAPVDGWSALHLASGVAIGFVVSGWLLPLGVMLGFEVVESVARRVGFRVLGMGDHESWANIAADVAIGMAGVAAVRLLWPGAGLWP